MGKITAKDLIEGVRGYSERQMISQFEEFLKSVEQSEYSIVPSKSAFADFIDQPRADIHEWCRLHPTADKQMQKMFADTIASGAMLKKYVPNITNFALKNWCGWEEAPQKKSQASKVSAEEKKAKEMLDEYIASERRKALRVAK